MAMIAAAAAAIIAIGLFIWFYYSVDPSSGLMPRCAFRQITGYECPGCGFQRAVHALLHGEVAEAWSYNAFVFFALPAAIFYIVAEAMRHRLPRLHAAANKPWIIALVGLAIVAWWIGRNL